MDDWISTLSHRLLLTEYSTRESGSESMFTSVAQTSTSVPPRIPMTFNIHQINFERSGQRPVAKRSKMNILNYLAEYTQ